MKSASSSRKPVAVLFALLMLAPIMPTGAADHTEETVPDLPILPHADPSDQCLPMGLDLDVLARVNELSQGDPSFFLTDRDVPALCVGGEPVDPYQQFIRDADKILNTFRNATREVQRQAEHRLEATLPEGELPMDLLHARTVLLSDRFDDRRIGGFGDWQVVTEHGEDPVLRKTQRETFNGTLHTWRVGDESGYERGAHQWLVSPEIDLTALRIQRTANHDLALAREKARDSLRFACNDATFGAPILVGFNPLYGVCQTDNRALLDNNFAFLVTAYENAFDAALKDVPVAQETAWLEFAYRMNLAPGEDGVRVWLFAGERAPDRNVLYDPAFGLDAITPGCPHDEITPLMPEDDDVPGVGPQREANATACTTDADWYPDQPCELACQPTVDGGWVLTDLPGAQPTRAFQFGAALGDGENTNALTGDQKEFVTARINLTNLASDHRLWLLFEVKTMADSSRGGSYFEDDGLFPRQEDYGFELARVHAEGHGYLRNFRLKDVADDLRPRLVPNEDGDPIFVRAVTPETDDPLVVRLQNAGQYTENGTVTVSVDPAGGLPLIDLEPRTVTQVRPNEVLTLSFPWPEGHPVEGLRYEVRAKLDVEDNRPVRVGEQTRGGAEDPRPQALDPNVTAVRPPNVPETGASPRLNVTGNQTLRARAIHDLRVVNALDDSTLPSFQVCSDVSDGFGCLEEKFAAEKGEPRKLLVGIRNDGNAVEHARAELSLWLDGVDKTTAILDGGTRELTNLVPGETRPVVWTVAPAEPGAYRALLTLFTENGESIGEPITRLLYVQRTTGTVCLDDFDTTRQCGPSFAGSVPTLLMGRNVTASTIGPDGAVYAATEVSERTGIIAARGSDGTWREIANVSSARLNATLDGRDIPVAWADITGLALAPNGTLYATGLNHTALALDLTQVDEDDGAAITPIATNETSNLTHFRDAAWFNDTLWTVGDDGAVFELVNGSLEEVNVTAWNDTLEAVQYDRDLAGMFVAPHGKMYVWGDDGFLTAFDGWTWQEATGANGFPLAWWLDNTTIGTMVAHEGRLYVAGDGFLLANVTHDEGYDASSDVSFRNVTLPAPVYGQFHPLLLFPSHLGDLYVVDAADRSGQPDRFYACTTCADPDDPGWTFPAVTAPSILVGDTYREARMTTVVTGDDATVLLGEGGALLALDEIGQYDHDGAWTTVPSLVARDGGVIQTNRSSEVTSAAAEDQSYRPTSLGDVPTDANGFRVRMNHFLRAADADSRAYVRLYFVDIPNPSDKGNVFVCPGQNDTAGTYTVCSQPSIMVSAGSFDEPTTTSTWETYVSPRVRGPADGVLTDVELLVEEGAQWAIDDIVVEALSGGEWVPVLAWYGIDRPDLNVPSDVSWTPERLGSVFVGGTVWETAMDPFDIEPITAWHMTTKLADRPVWAFNDEVWTHAPGGARPHLRDGWNARLLTPIINLTDAYDPVVTFRHAYAFRAQAVPPAENSPLWPKVKPGDGGWVEVQYLKHGKECGEEYLPDETCWSGFYRMKPENDYPTTVEAGFANHDVVYDKQPYDPGSIGPQWIPGDPRNLSEVPGVSYWGRSPTMQPTAERVIEGGRFTQDYEEARFVLADQVCDPGADKDDGQCVPTSLAGRQIRVGFHVQTSHSSGSVYNASHKDYIPQFGASYPGEGWYITDFKVLGASELGIDLRAANLTFNVGYDVDRIGVGPGTSVPVNVTVENRGIFEVAGYEGELAVFRVVDALTQQAELVERVPLPQQPVLESGKSRNHTLRWEVPPEEGARYFARMVIEPLGIDLDEDATDNVAFIGGFSRPVLARTHPEFDIEFHVTPENATTEITRYVPIYIRNTGNVDLSGFTVTRDITILQGPLTRRVDERAWTVSRAVPAGTRVALASVSDDLNPTEDLFYKAPERANYMFSVGARVLADGELLTSGMDRRISAYATYLFDDVEGGPRGEAISGDWNLSDGWGVNDQGFRSPNAYGFGDARLDRYPADADASATSPTIDLSAARSARLAFYHRYAFEPRFDGGQVEASLDGGETWHVLKPSPDPLNELPLGYVHDEPISAASVLHVSGNPNVEQLAFTGDSSELPANVDGWVLSQFDLTDLPAIVEQDVAYEAFDYDAMQGYGGLGGNVTDPITGQNATRDSSWIVGAEVDFRYWEAQNLTHNAVTSVAGNDSIWWSGSADLEDDGVAPDEILMLQLNVSLADVADGEVVAVDWWEWGERYGMSPWYHEGGSQGHPSRDDMLNAYNFHSGASKSQNHRFNVSEPDIVERKGKWFHMRSIITDYVDDPVVQANGGFVNLSFVYAPVVDKNQKGNPADYYGHFMDDRGFAIDGFHVTATRFARGDEVVSHRVLLSEEDAWETSRVFRCEDITNRNAAHKHPCFYDDGSTQKAQILDVLEDDPLTPGNESHVPGKTWSLAKAVPATQAGWAPVPITGPYGHNADNPTPTGVVPKAWYTGDLGRKTDKYACDLGGGVPCPAPGGESRLVTPAMDLSIVSGEDAFLKFWHRYAFMSTKSIEHHPLAGGGAVEISVFDEQTGTWSSWKQIYSDPANMTATPLGKTGAHNSSGRGGYSAYTVNVTSSTAGMYRQVDAPFESHFDEDAGTDVQFLYSGKSIDVDSDGKKDGWVLERYDVSDYIGKKVRFGFHTYWAAAQRSLQDPHVLIDPDGDGKDKGGWWVTNISLVGKVLTGAPLELRMRAATDGNVDDGHWMFDDLGVFGARYQRNVGLFIPDGDYGAVKGRSTTVPVVLRNLGDSVRRDLAVEVLVADKEVGLTLDGTAPGGTFSSGNLFRFQGYTLAPGQSAVINLTVTAPDEVGEGARTKLLFAIKQFNPVSTAKPYVNVIDNEVQGFLRREVPFTLSPAANWTFTDVSVAPELPKVGEPVDLVVTVRNNGYTPFTVEPTCDARTVRDFAPADHGTTDAEFPAVAAEYECTLVEGETTVEPGASTKLRFQIVPTTEGFIRFDVGGRMVDGIFDKNFTTFHASAVVGDAGQRLSQDFSLQRDLANWTRAVEQGTPARWEHLRGNRGPGAMLLGMDENFTGTGASYAGGQGCARGTCRAITPPVDLHNYTENDRVFLSFWHQDRFAKGDGGQVHAQILRNERNPGLNSNWERLKCVIRPVGGYEGSVQQFVAPAAEMGSEREGGNPPPGDDLNPAFRQPHEWNRNADGRVVESRPDYFISEGGTWENGWDLAVFDLSQNCALINTNNETVANESLIGKTVRFVFNAYVGHPGGRVDRGPGHGWLIDDVSVGPHALALQPSADQKAVLLDNTTKAFNVLVRNLGPYPDVVRLGYDARNSSAPAGSIQPPTDPIVIQPGESRLVQVNVTLPRDPSLLPTNYKARVTVTSLIDANAYADNVLDLFFAPRQWAELSLQIEPPRTPVQEGTEAFLPITIENNGLVENVPSKLLIVDEWDGGRREYALDVPSMSSYFQNAEDATRTLEFRWRPDKGSIGMHTLRLVLDPERRGEEYTRTNNELVLDVEVSELLIPDLSIVGNRSVTLRDAVGGVVIGDRDADVTRYEITAGELTSFDVRVRNLGRAGATNVDVRAFVGALSLPPKNIPYVAPDTEVVMSFNWLAQKGEHRLEFLVRSEQVELSLDNNRNPARGVTLLTVKGYDVDVSIPSIDDVLEPGTEIDMPFKIRNTGNAGEDLRLKGTAPGGMRLLLPRSEFYLRAGEVYEGVATLQLPGEALAGEQFISIEAVSRENPMKVASARTPVHVKAFYGGSVSDGVAQGHPATLTVPVELVNEGNSMEPWTVALRLPPGWSAAETLPAKVVVPPHERKQVDFTVRVPEATVPGTRVVEVNATMPNGESREATVRVNVLPLRAATVTLAEDDVPAPKRGKLTLPLKVQNNGNVQAPFEMILLNKPKGIDVRVEPAHFELAPGAQAEASLIIEPNESVQAGTYVVTGYALFDGVMPDSREGRANVQALRVPVLRQDVLLDGIQYAPRADLNAGDRVTVKVPLVNRGQAALTDVPVHLYVDDVFIMETIVPRVGAGETVDVTLNWTAVTGAHTLTAVVDPYEDTVDANREDNAVSALATVGTDSPVGGLAAGRANVPGPSMLGVLVAIGLALVAIPLPGSRRPRR